MGKKGESNKPLCENCKYFDYEESWDGEEEFCFFMCKRNHDNIIGWYKDACEDFLELV